MLEIIPGILEKDWVEIEKKLEQAKSFAKAVHIDLIDEKFAQNTTFLDPKPFVKYSKDLVLELHMMVDNPLQYLKPFADAGFKRFLGHIENLPAGRQGMPDIAEFVAEGQLLGEVGLAVDGPTSLEALNEVNLEDLDLVLIMMIKAGQSGQTFMPEYLEKVKKLKEKVSGEVLSPEFRIEVDGGINAETIIQARDAGANRFVATSFIWNSPDPKAAYENLQSIINS